MDAVLLLIMAASGLSAVSSQVRRQYHFVYDEKNMTEAQKYCRETYTDLATIDNMEDVKILNDTVDRSKAFPYFWMGLYDDVNSWRWSLSDTSFYRDEETEFRLWGSGQPNNYNSREYCTLMNCGGRWNDYVCMNPYRTVCMDVRGLNVTFVLIETPMNWTQAQSYCREHHTDLASVRNMTENQKVKDLVPAGQWAWIGLYRDSWKWSDGSDSSFRYWAEDQPNNYGGKDACVVAQFGRGGTWLDAPCDQNRPFICYGPPAVQTTSSSSTTSSTTQPDAAAVQTTSSSSTTSSTTQPGAAAVQTTSSSSTTSSTTQPDAAAVQTTSSSSTTSSTTQPDAGLSAVSSQVRRQFHFVYDRKNMTEAQKYCREKYTDLATIDNMEDMKMLNDTVDTSKAFDGVWIGLYDDMNSWRWSLSDTSFYRDGETEFRLWASGDPDNANSREYCTQMYSGRWNDCNCEVLHWSVCMDVRGLNVTFVLITTSMNWTEAQSYCREHHTDLASVRNMTENQKVKDLVPAGHIAWIGLFRDSWKWSDGSSSSFRHWLQGEPDNQGGNQACVVVYLHSDGTWRDNPCDQNRPFICYGPPAVQTTSSSSTTSSTTQPDAVTMTTKQVIKVRLERKDSSLDLNDPAVMEQMLKEVQQRLKDQGVKGDVKLSWRKQADGKVFHEEEEETKKKKKTCPMKDEI